MRIHFFYNLCGSFSAQCVEFLERQAETLKLESNVFYPHSPSRPVVVLTLFGTDRELPSIMLNSHMDVVAVDEKYWSHAPFGAEIDENGRIFARGAQDMKSVGMQYLAAIRAIKRDEIRLKRTIHVVYTPDEEIGGFTGMVFVWMKEWPVPLMCSLFSMVNAMFGVCLEYVE